MVDWFAVTGFVLSSIVAGIMGNRADALFCQYWQKIYERLRRGGIPVNHDLQRAIRKAILQATLSLLSDILRERGLDIQNLLSRLWRRLPFPPPMDEERRWLKRVYDELAAELKKVSDAEYVPPSSLAESQLASLLQPQGVTAAERTKEWRERVVEGWLRELEERFGKPPEVFVIRLKEGWQPTEATERVFWFDLVCAFFAHEVKHNQVVANIVKVNLLAGLTVDKQSLSDALIAYLKREFASVLQRLDEIQKRLEELGRQQREGFEELKEQQAEMIATFLLTMREMQQTMQALLLEIGKWVRWMAERYGGEHVATYLDDETRQFLRKKWQEGFVGRKEAMERLNRFIATNTHGVAIVYAPAGYGKTTFLAHWIRQVEEKGGWLSGDGQAVLIVVRHFFNPTIHLSQWLSNAYAHLLAQLSRLSDQLIPIPDDEDERWAALHNFLAKLQWPEGVKLVIVLDGLDDAKGEVKPFIPSKIPEGLFVVVSGRWDGEGEVPPYLKEWAKFTEFIPLKALSEDEIREWLRKAGEGELAHLAENDEFVQMLRAKTDGLPLFVRYLIDDLLQAIKEGKSPEKVLERTPLGFSEYVKEQVQQLSKLVRNEKGVQDLFALLTVAKGALCRREVKELTGLSVWDLKGLPHQVTRWFSIGRAHPYADLPPDEMETYAFAHPLLSEEFRKHLGREAEEMEEKLLEWCEGWREHTFPYILRHYADHLYERWWQKTFEQKTYFRTPVPDSQSLYSALCQLALDTEFAQSQTLHLPDEPNLPLKTVQLALDAAIKLEDAPMMARLLMEHAKRAQSEEETPLQAWRKGHRERALRMATEIIFERDHKLGTLWGLLLAWEAESEGERDWAKRFLDEVRERWKGAKLTGLEDWQVKMAAFLLSEMGQVEGAIKVAGLVLGDYGKKELATNWAAKRLFEHALKVAEGIEDARVRAWALRDIAVEMAKARMFEKAMETAERIEDAYEQEWALSEIAKEMAKVGMEERAKEVFEQALKVAEGIEDAKERAWALREIAKEIAKAGMKERAKEIFEQALKTAEGIRDAREQAEALREIAVGMAKAGMFEQALEAAEGIKQAQLRADALSEIAGEMAKVGMEERAKEVFEQALKVAEGIEEAWERADALSEIAEVMAKAGMEERAIEIFHHALQVTEGIEPIGLQALPLRKIARMMAKAGMTEWAEEVFERALQITKGIEDEFLKARVLTWITWAMADSKIEKRILWQQTLQVVEGIKNRLEQAEELQVIAEGMAKVGVQDKTVWQQALQIAEGIEDIREERIMTIGLRAKAMIAIIEAMAKLGLFEKALEVAEKVKEVGLRESALRVIAKAMTEAGVFEQALKVAEKIEETRSWSWALWGIAVAMAEVELFDQALKVIERIEIAGLKASAMCSVISEMAKVGLFDRALKLAEEMEWGEWTSMQASALGEIAKALAKVGMFDKALQVAGKIERSDERVRALVAIAEAMAKIGMKEKAKEVLEQAMQEEIGIEALVAIAEVMAKIGMKERAEEVFDRAIETVERIGPDDVLREVFQKISRDEWVSDWAYERATALKAIAGRMSKVGMVERAKEIFVQALQMAERNRWAEERSLALKEIAKEMADAGVQEKTLWQQTLKVAEGIEEAWWRAEALRAIAEAMVKVGEVKGAVGIVKRAIGLRTKMLPSVLLALAWQAMKGDVKSKEGFLRLLPLCGWSLDLAYRACGLLAWLYPEQVEEIAKIVSGE